MLLTPSPVRAKYEVRLQLVATVNRPVIDRGLFPSTKTHGQEGADRGYPLAPAKRYFPKKSRRGSHTAATSALSRWNHGQPPVHLTLATARAAEFEKRKLCATSLFPSTKTHGQEGADRGYPIGQRT